MQATTQDRPPSNTLSTTHVCTLYAMKPVRGNNNEQMHVLFNYSIHMCHCCMKDHQESSFHATECTPHIWK